MTQQAIISYCNNCKDDTTHKLTIRKPKEGYNEYACNSCGNNKHVIKESI